MEPNVTSKPCLYQGTQYVIFTFTDGFLAGHIVMVLPEIFEEAKDNTKFKWTGDKIYAVILDGEIHRYGKIIGKESEIEFAEDIFPHQPKLEIL